MTLPSPNLDDRRFADLVQDAALRLERSCPAWSDRSPNDPGMALVEVFAHLTEVMLYRLNRVPEKAYVEFLRLMGATLRPPAAATVTLVFRRTGSGRERIDIPRGTAVAASASTDGPPPVFLTTAAAVLAPGSDSVAVRALHAEAVAGELVGTGTGRPGLSVFAAKPPLIADAGEGSELLVGVELGPDERPDRAAALRWEGKSYRLWHEVASFTDLDDDRHVFIADRTSGRITFAPALTDPRSGRTEALAEIPALGREIRLWYLRGGGPGGNVAAGMLTALKQAIPGVAVSNPAAAAGGRAGESIEHAIIRGPTEFQSLHRAVTARDFEALALRASGGVARALAATAAERWMHAVRGTVEVIIVPTMPAGIPVDAATLAAQQTDAVRATVLTACEERRALGTRCTVEWARFKTARVQARVVVHREEDPAAVRARVLERLHAAINPLPSAAYAGGWPFGRALRASHVYDIVLAEPGVSYVDRVRLFQDEVPDAAVARVAADRFQPHTWYAAAEAGLFRSTNDGDGWEAVGPRGPVQDVCPSPREAGLVAVATADADGDVAIRVSRDCGETWRLLARTTFAVSGMAWLDRAGAPVLLLATAAGLFELALSTGAVPVPVLVDARDPSLGFYAVLVTDDGRGGQVVAVAARRQAGVFLSWTGGTSGSFTAPELAGEDVRALCVQADGPRRFVWAGVAAPGDSEGRGCFRLELRAADAPERWHPLIKGWNGGSVRCLASDGTRIVAGTHRAGVVVLDSSAREPAWQGVVRGLSGLPIRRDEREGLQPVDSVALAKDAALILAGGPAGVWRSSDAKSWQTGAAREAIDRLTLPDTWLFCSGAHDVLVVGDDDTTGHDATQRA
jgi:hypothetical protein